jgi:hypothetical protein
MMRRGPEPRAGTNMAKTKLRDLDPELTEPVKRLLMRGGEREELAQLLVKHGHLEDRAADMADDLDAEFQDQLRSGQSGAGDDAKPERIAGVQYCSACEAKIAEGDKFCDACGAKVLDDVDEFHFRSNIEPAMKKGAQWIGAVAILYVLGGILMYAMNEDTTVLAFNLVLAAIQAGLWQWAKRSLLPAAIAALVLFVTVHLASAVIEPESIIRGIFIKVVFLVVLARAIQAGLEARKLRRAGA